MASSIGPSTAVYITPATPPTLNKTFVASFLTKVLSNQESRMDWTVEEVIIERLFLTLKELPAPSFEELEAFFSLLVALKEEPFEKEVFKKICCFYQEKRL